MPKRYALVRDADGIVENVILAEDNYVHHEDDVTAVPDDGQAAVGGKWDGADFSPPPPEPPPVPEKIEMWRARAVLDQQGALARADQTAASAGPVISAFWKAATEIQRDSPTLNAFAAQIGLDAAALDDLFRAAAALTV